MGKVKEYLLNIAQDIHDGNYIDREDIDYENNGPFNYKVIIAGIQKYINKETGEDSDMRKFLNAYKSEIANIISEIMNIPGDDSDREYGDTNDWTDPAGGMHYGNEDDPAKMYEMQSLFEDSRKYNIKEISNIAIRNKRLWIDNQNFKYFTNEIEDLKRDNDFTFEDMVDKFYVFLDDCIDKFFKLLVKQNDIEIEYLEENRDVIIYNVIESFIPEPTNRNEVSDQKFGDEDVEEDKVLAATMRKSKEKYDKPKIKDYSKMNKYDLQREVDAAIDKKDYDTLKKIQPFIKEGFLKQHIREFLNEEFKEISDPIKDMKIGKGHWFEKVKKFFIKEIFGDEDSTELFMDIANDKLEKLYQKGSVAEEAADICYSDINLYDKWFKQMQPNGNGFPQDDLKANCRSWQGSGDKEDADELVTYLISRYSNFSEDELRQIAYDWVGVEDGSDLDEGCNCGGGKPRPRPRVVNRPKPRPKLRPLKLHEKFTPAGDPIKDMGIGIDYKKIAKKFLDDMYGNINKTAEVYFGNPHYEGYADVLYGFVQRLYRGERPQDAFLNSCNDENFYGNRQDIIEDRMIIAHVISDKFGIEVNPFFNGEGPVDECYMMKPIK